MAVEQQPQSENAARFHAQQDDVFGRIADRYDLLCDLFSFGIHRLWKRRVAAVIASQPWSRLLDCAAGTGDVVLRLLSRQHLQNGQTIMISDISPQMLAVARKRFGPRAASLEFHLLDAHAMPSVPDASVDLYSISLGLKICERARVLKEAMRVLRPNGRFVSLEASNIVWPWLHRRYLQYMSLCIPMIGWVATSGDASAYQYLLRGIQDFPTAETLARELASVGFEDISFERLSLGIAAIHTARKRSTLN